MIETINDTLASHAKSTIGRDALAPLNLTYDSLKGTFNSTNQTEAIAAKRESNTTQALIELLCILLKTSLSANAKGNAMHASNRIEGAM